MELSSYANSQAFFEISSGAELIQFNTLRERWLCLKDFLIKTAILPFALLFKASKTFFRLAGILFAAGFLIATLGTSSSGREFFIERTSIFAKDLADWVLFTLAVAVWFIKLLLALMIHPDIYFSR